MKKIPSLLIIGFCLIIVFQACKETIEPLPELTVTSSQLTIEYGTTAIIMWTAINATSCSSDVGNITGVTGSVTTPPLIKSTTYSFTATGPGGTVTSTITIQVNAAPKPTLKVTVDIDTISKGETVNLLIESTNATGIQIKGVTSGNISENTTPVTTEKTFNALNGTFTSWPILETTQFTITATGIDGSFKVASPIIIVPTRTDTICGSYWMVISSKSFFDNEWVTWKLDEDKLTRKEYYYKNGTYEVFKKNGEVVGNGYWNLVGQDSINISEWVYNILLTDTTMTFSSTYLSDGKIVTSIGVYRGYKISSVPK